MALASITVVGVGAVKPPLVIRDPVTTMSVDAGSAVVGFDAAGGICWGATVLIVPSGTTGDDPTGTSCTCAKAGAACKQAAIAMRLAAPICGLCVRNVLDSIAIMILSQPSSLFLVTLSSAKLARGRARPHNLPMATSFYDVALTCPFVFIYATEILLVKWAFFLARGGLMSVAVQSPRDKVREQSTVLISNDVYRARGRYPLILKLRLIHQGKLDKIHGSVGSRQYQINS
jgi:hypothetical protein